MKQNSELVIGIIGAGGIGSNLTSILYPALQQGNLVKKIGDIRICIYDSDTVERNNLPHQKFSISDIGGLKVISLCNQLWSNIDKYTNGPNIILDPSPWDIRSKNDLRECDLVVVAVDSHQARKVVHENCDFWLDLRCLGDGYIAIDNSVDNSIVSQLTPNQDSQSCQFKGAIESGNIQFGYISAAAHGAQWIIQSLRIISGEENVQRPLPQISNITFGTATRLEQRDEPFNSEDFGKSISPRIHTEFKVDEAVSSGYHDSIIIKETLAGFAQEKDWISLWNLADSLGREVSVLYDKNSTIWVDIGTSGRVELSPPIGSFTPYKLWIHTHPLDAYWSSTDKDTIAAYSEILDEALVLGHDHFKRTVKLDNFSPHTLDKTGPLSNWSDEQILYYEYSEVSECQ
jgi:hypothetical protein|tara:strand:+ start:199 stop:1404 length:1206 start_codon:yes stop_codon:yes gene_type:complete